MHQPCIFCLRTDDPLKALQQLVSLLLRQQVTLPAARNDGLHWLEPRLQGPRHGRLHLRAVQPAVAYPS